MLLFSYNNIIFNMKFYPFDLKELYLNYYFQKHPLKFPNGFSEDSLSMIEQSEEMKNLSTLLKKTHFNDNSISLTSKINLLNNFIVDLDNLINKKITIRKETLLFGLDSEVDFTVNNFLLKCETSNLGDSNIVSYDYINENYSLELASEEFLNISEASFCIINKNKFDYKIDSQAINTFRKVFEEIEVYIKKEYDNSKNRNFLNSLFKNIAQYSDSYLSIFSNTDVKEINFKDTQKLFNDLNLHSEFVALSSDTNLKEGIEGLNKLNKLILNTPIKNKKEIK